MKTQPEVSFTPASHMMQALSFITKSLEKKEAVELPPTKTEGADPVVQPKFTTVETYDPLNPWKDTGTDDDSDFVQLYVTRDFRDIEAVAEVTRCSHHGDEADHNDLDCVQIGNCFDLRGNFIELSLEEQDKARQDWIANQEQRTDAEY